MSVSIAGHHGLVAVEAVISRGKGRSRSSSRSFRALGSGASELRHQLGMPDLDRAALKILRDIRVIVRHPLKGL
jgi:hypothetical protein